MIAYGMLYAAGVGLPILLAALVSSAFLREHGRAERGVWFAALLLALALPAFALTGPPAQAPAGAIPVVGTGLIGLPTVVAVPQVTLVTVPVARASFGLDEILIGLWLLASLVLAIRWAVASAKLARLTRSFPAATVDGVPVRLTDDLGPAVAGWVRPRILVPSWLMSMPEEQRSLVLLHEEEHVRAGDPLLIAVSRVARVLVPWNPFVWLLSSRLVRAVELDCDRRVLRRRPDVRAYGTTLLTVSCRDPGALVGAAAFAEAEAPLRRRILAMTTPRGTVSVLSLFTALVLGILLILGAFEVPVPTAAHDATNERIAALEAQLKQLEARQAEATGRAQPSGTIAGTVRDVVTDQPIRNVQVFLRDAGIGGLTDPNGQFLLLHVPAGDREVVAQRIGFGEAAQKVTVTEGATVDVDFGLQQTAVELDRVVVTGELAAGPAGPPEAGPAPDGATPPVEVDRVPAEPRSSQAEGSRPIFTPFTVAPRLLNTVEVQRATRQAYPAELRDAGIGGTVAVWFFIAEDGVVQDYRINESSGHESLDDAALSVAGTYRFSPALNRDERVAVWVAFPITFLAGG